MSERDDYLWDPATTPDPEVERLEGLLSRFRHEPGAPPAFEPAPRVTHAPTPIWSRFAAPFGVLAAAALVLLMLQLRRDDVGRGPGYVVRGGDVDFIEAGDTLVAVEDVTVDIWELGDVRVDAGTRMRVERVAQDQHALFVEEGRVHAFITADPRVFQVGSPAALTIDLGCEYTLDVQSDGTTELSVLTGQVSFGGADGREVYVPAGASCSADVVGYVSPPLFDDARAEFRELVLMAASGDLFAMKTGIGDLVDFQDRDEGLPLFALLSDPHVPDWSRGMIFDALERGFQLPAGVTREGVLGGDAAQLSEWVQASRYWWRRGATSGGKGD